MAGYAVISIGELLGLESVREEDTALVGHEVVEAGYLKRDSGVMQGKRQENNRINNRKKGARICLVKRGNNGGESLRKEEKSGGAADDARLLRRS